MGGVRKHKKSVNTLSTLSVLSYFLYIWLILNWHILSSNFKGLGSFQILKVRTTFKAWYFKNKTEYKS